MQNAQEEFLEHIENRDVLCAHLQLESEYGRPRSEYRLNQKYLTSEYQVFLKSLDFDYDDGFGGQELFGVIWYSDGTWSERAEYDGSEWWEYKTCPAIPEGL